MLQKTFEPQPALRILAQRTISLSLDVFDTTLIRRSSTRELFKRLGAQASEEWADWTLSADEFARWREISEERANREHGGGRFVLSDIYRHFAHGYSLAAEQVQWLMDAELALEAEHLVAVPEMAQKISLEHSEGRSVLFLSDMYLPSNWLRSVLLAHGLWQEGDRLFISGEAKASKSRGDLFELAAEQLGSRLAEPIHFGDNPWSDVAQAKASGWRAELFSNALPTARESLLASHSPDFGEMPEALAAAARMVRLQALEAHSPELATHLEVTTAVAAPVLVAYVVWCLRKAKALGLKRLYFMTRDGIVMHDAFHELIKKVGAEDQVEAKILAASRQVCRLSNIRADAPQLPNWATYDPYEITVTSCLFRVGLKPSDFETTLNQFGFKRQNWDRPLVRREIERLREVLHIAPVREAINTAAENARSCYEEYLTESGLYDGTPAAIVDIGWRGSTFDSLVSRAPESARPSLHLFLFGFLGEGYDGLNGDRIHSYYCDNWRGCGEIGGDRLVTVMEDFVAVEEGTLTELACDAAGRVQPVFRAVEHSALVKERFAINKNTPKDLIKALSKSQLETWCVERMTPVWKNLIDDFWNTPTPAELREFSQHEREVDQSGHVSVKLATPYSWSELAWWVAGLRPLTPGITCWAAGRRALTTGWRHRLLAWGEGFHARRPGFSTRVRRQKQRCGAFLRRRRAEAEL